MSKKAFRIGEVAARCGVSVATLRYYERRGLIPAPARSPSGYRAYPDDTVDVVKLIRRMQRLGFSLEEILALLDKRSSPTATCADVRADLRRKIEVLDAQIRELVASRDHLSALVGRCTGREDEPARGCPILVGLEEPAPGEHDS